MFDMFICKNCNFTVKSFLNAGVKNRNHCPKCLYSLHLDKHFAGDRNSKCQGLMKPIGLTFKKGGANKYRKDDYGEIMIIHNCKKCDKISLNRIAGDDEERKIVDLIRKSKKLNKRLQELKKKGNIFPIESKDIDKVLTQLKGNNFKKEGPIAQW